MSKKHHNYTNYSKPQQQAPVVETSVTPTVEPTIETSVTPTVEPTIETSVTPTVEPTIAPEPTPAEPEPVYGVVSECARLNVRKEPNMNADVVTVLDLATEVLVDKANSTEDFYKIVTGTGVEGYCIKSKIKLD